MTVIIECISWLINVTDNIDAWWKPETKEVCFSVDMTFDLFLHLKTNPIGKMCLAKTTGI
jgi:hypothetical protein